ncbi:hypothetical protein COX74_02950 [bacterium (Candidatus Gribaldobacteria) CG_4_10_14_0_2_um_filter_41_16]|uniref:PAC domain-containing protein n=4 Tax=Candidatus Gribaldobacteria TaxID=2798536 RepID=A0A2M7VHT0_9BACT|nr:MAG: hypothetical protein AUJ36_00435 [Parcubacteria group bacterium CG1_02_41_26]PIR91079.1 MAG: hypothetical protein COU03_03165 [bacterium (Candidatus Gribaldobacteria) CG10_big_fil_rev_8_21_14_0_10_41_12]PIV47198.1 MAG: hypothetical protein COS21_01215 [bacterium (Candidatus Gribaldobacteria) CG02_land_8_20_14_3_00_41_15]PIX03224.1 MAG: hypothetical protein COZ78_01450 [bacterium (Candidatus Gribaldobacteria) CG_4_8_14_3_um_filter_42_11]PJA01392.1 MAG: hypothetical protein COX74_02950 [b
MDKENNFSKRREKELAEDTIVLEKAIKNFWEILPIPVCTASPIFIILETGKGFDTLFGYIKNELVGESLKEIAFDKDSFKKILSQLAEQRKISNVEAVLKNKKGEKISVFVSAIAQEDEQREVFSYLFSFVDITLMKKTERELQEKVADLERFQKIAIGRELKMVELKQEIEDLKIKINTG